MKRPGPLTRRSTLRRKTALKRGAPLKRSTGMKRTGIARSAKPLKRTRRRETAAERRARECFAFEVCAVDLCFFADVDLALEPRRPGHVCDGDGDLDPHHLIAKSWIQRYFGDLPEDELLAIKYAPIIGCPLCRCAHEGVPANLKPGDRVFFEELDEDLIDFCERLDRRYAGTGRPSFLTRLRLECPRRSLAEGGAAAGLQQPPLVGAGADAAPNPPGRCGADGNPPVSADSGESDAGCPDPQGPGQADRPYRRPVGDPGAAQPDHANAGNGAEAEGVALAPSPAGASAVSGSRPDQQTKEPA